MKEKLFLALKTKYSNLGLSDETLRGVSAQLENFVKEESGIESAVASSEAILKSIQSESDRRSSASKTELEQLRAENEKLKKTEPPKNDPPKTDPPANDIATAIAAAMAPIVAEISGLKDSYGKFSQERTHVSLSEKFTKAMTDKKIPTSFYDMPLSMKQFKDENDVNEFVTAIEGKYGAHKQSLTNEGFSYTAPPEDGNDDKKDGSDFANAIAAGTKQIVESQKK